MLEAVVVALGLFYLVLIVMEKRIGWLFGTVGSVLFVVSNIQQHLYMDCLLNFYYVVVGIYGWWLWGKANKKEALPVAQINRQLFIGLLAISGLLTLAFGAALNHYTNNSLPYLDAGVTVLSFLATWMAAKKYIENWLLWLVADPLAVALYSAKYYPATNWWLYPGLFIVYTAMAAYGYYTWKKDLTLNA